MSGIAGIIHFDGAPVSPGLVEKMTSAMAYRGPDGIHHWIKGPVALGQCMLCTTPESLEETQPLANEDESLILVMDGRVDNWVELRRELLANGCLLRDRSDAELVLRAYETWGRECLQHIDGDFALVIWDARRHEAWCARDRLGNKPFNYFWDGKTLVFASELHAILAMPWVPQVFNEDVLAEYLAWEFYSRDETLWRGILRLVAAHHMVVGQRGPQPEQYWAPDPWEILPYSKDEDYFEHYRELIFESVRRYSRSHQPVSIEVSGGLDSSAVICIAEHLHRSDGLPAPAIEGYTLAFTGDNDANELAYARAVGDYLGVRIHEIPPSRMPLSWYTKQASTYLDFPCYPNASMFLGVMEQAALTGSRVVMTGEGGDEWLEGWRNYYAEELAQWHWQRFLDCFRADVRVFGMRQAMTWVMRYGFFPLLPDLCQGGLRWLRHGSRTRDVYWLSAGMRKRVKLRRGQPRQSCNQPVKRFGQRQLFEILYDPFSDLVMEEGERNAARSGLEMRYPFRAYRVVQYAFSTPERLRLRGDIRKYIHVNALRDIMPGIILERKDKAEFMLVFHQHLDQMKEEFTETLPRERADWFVSEGMGKLFKVYENNPQHGPYLWILWSIFGCHCIDNK